MLFYVSNVHACTVLHVVRSTYTLPPGLTYMVCVIYVFKSTPCNNSNKYARVLVNIIKARVVFLSECIAFRTAFVPRTSKKQYQKTT